MQRTSLLACLLLWATSSTAGIDLFRPPLETFARIGPDGRMLAVAVNEGETQRIDGIDLETLERRTLFETASLNDEKSAVTGLSWVDGDTLVIAVVELTEGIAKLRDTRHRRHVFVIDIAGESPLVRYIESSGMLIDSLPDRENELLYARLGTTSIVYRIRTDQLHEWGKPLAKTAQVDGGQFGRANRVATVEGFAPWWITDRHGTVRAVLSVQPENGIALNMRESDEADWHLEKRWEPEKKKRRNDDDEAERVIYRPAALIADSRDFVVITNEDDGRHAVYRYNYASESKTLIYRHPSAEIVDLGLNADATNVSWVSYFEDGVVKYHYVEDAYRAVAASVEQRFPGMSVQIVAADGDERRYVLSARSSRQPGRVFVFEPATDRLEELYAVMPWLDESALSDSTAGTVNSHGLDIEYFLTLPDAHEPAPLVVHPHGGPWGVLDDRHFNPVVQYLASRGLAVLQVNYRGSGGYGEQFLDEAQGEFGRRMIDDVEAALAAVTENPAVDASRVCAAGSSYGGYAALMLALRSPQDIHCVASLAGVTDLGLLLGSYEDEASDFMLSLMLPPDTSPQEGYGQLKDLSPLYAANGFGVPMLLAHGREDTRVDIEHSLRLLGEMRRLGKPVEWHSYEDMGHHFDGPEAAFEYYRTLADFIVGMLGSVGPSSTVSR